MRMKTYAFLAKTYAKKGMSDATDAMKTLSAKTKKHIKKHKQVVLMNSSQHQVYAHVHNVYVHVYVYKTCNMYVYVYVYNAYAYVYVHICHIHEVYQYLFQDFQ